MLKKILITFFSLFLLLAISFVGLIVFLPKDKVINAILEKMNEDPAININIRGAKDIYLFPNIAVAFENTDLTYRDKITLSSHFDKIEAQLSIMELLFGNYKVKKIILTRPEIVMNLKGASSRSQNFYHNSLMASNAVMPQRVDAAFNPKQFAPLEKLSIDQFEMVQGAIKILMPKEEKMAFTKVNLLAKLPSIQKALQLETSFDYQKSTHHLAIKLDNLEALLFEGRNADFSMQFKNKFGENSFKGDLALKDGMPNYHGRVTLETKNLVGFMTPFMKGGMRKLPIQTLTMKADVTGTSKQSHLKIKKLSLDKINLDGTLYADLGAALPFIQGELHFTELNLNPFFKKQAIRENLLASNTLQFLPHMTKEVAALGSDARIDLSILRQFNADLDIVIDNLLYKNLIIADLRSKAINQNARLKLEMTSPSLLGGSMTIDAILNAQAARPSFSTNISLRAIQSDTLINAIAERAYLSGPFNFSTQLKSQGRTRSEIIANLRGPGNFVLAAGNINGIDLANPKVDLINLIQTREFNSTMQTPLRNLRAHYQTRGGIMEFSEIHAETPAFSIDGTGPINLPKEKLKLYMVPTPYEERADLVGTLLASPFFIQGRFSHVRIIPDIIALAPKLLDRALKKQRKEGLTPQDLFKQLKKPKDLLKLFK